MSSTSNEDLLRAKVAEMAAEISTLKAEIARLKKYEIKQSAPIDIPSRGYMGYDASEWSSNSGR